MVTIYYPFDNPYPNLWLTSPISRSVPVRPSSQMQQYRGRCRELNVYAELMPRTAKANNLTFKAKGLWYVHLAKSF